MKTTQLLFIACSIIAVASSFFAEAFSPSSSLSSTKTRSVVASNIVNDNAFGSPLVESTRIDTRISITTPGTSLSATSTNNDDTTTGVSWEFNPLYATFLVGFLTYAFAFAGIPGQPLVGAEPDTSIINAFLDDPLHPANVDLIFVQIFNILGILPMVLTSLIIPQSAKKGLPAWPFAFTGLVGYPGFAPYLSFRAPPVESKTLAEASWFTANILENKIFSWSLVALMLSCPITTGLSDAVMSSTDPNIWGQLVADYVSEFQTTKIVSASSVDLAILTVTAATLIPRDYQLRVGNDPVKLQQGNLIGAATVLFPALGAALYCALRPSLPEE